MRVSQIPFKLENSVCKIGCIWKIFFSKRNWEERQILEFLESLSISFKIK